MSGGTKKEETKQQTTQQVQLPEWLTQAGQDVYGQAKTFSDANPVKAYTAPMAPGLADNQRQASAVAAASQGTGQRDLGAARALTGAAAGGTVAPINAGTFGSAEAASYSNPYTEQVQQRTLLEMMRQNKISDDGLRDGIQGAGAYGGTRQSVLEAEKAKGDGANMLDYLARSNLENFSQAQQQFNVDRAARVGAESTNNANTQSLLDRILAAGGQAASIGGQASAMNTTDISNLARTGAVEQATEGDQLSSAYQEFLRNENAPLDRYTTLMSLLTGTPKNVTTTGSSTGNSTSTQSGGLLNALLGGGQIAASIFSDPRLKRDMQLIERRANGLGIYRFNYLWDGDDEPERIGVNADEVGELQPWALGPTIGGFKTVYYGKLQGML